MFRILVLSNEPLSLALCNNGEKELVPRTVKGAVYFTDSTDIGLRTLAHNKKISISKVKEGDSPKEETNLTKVSEISITEEKPLIENTHVLGTKTGNLELVQEKKNLNVIEKRNRKKRVSKKNGITEKI